MVLIVLGVAACGEIFADISPPMNEDEIRDLFADTTDVYADLSNEVNDLDAPDDAAIERFRDRLERNARGLRDGLEQDDLTSDAFASARMNSMAEARDLASEAGLTDCAELES